MLLRNGIKEINMHSNSREEQYLIPSVVQLNLKIYMPKIQREVKIFCFVASGGSLKPIVLDVLPNSV